MIYTAAKMEEISVKSAAAAAGLREMDKDIAELLKDKTLRLIRVAWFADLPDDWMFKRRQDLEQEMEETAFLLADTASALLLSAKRKVFVFSCELPLCVAYPCC